MKMGKFIISIVFRLPKFQLKINLSVAFLSLVIIPHVYAGTVTIQAEDYRSGGENVAYYDHDSRNIGDAGIRTDEGVDLYIKDGIIRIGSVKTGEWVTWAYTFPETDTYKFTFYVATRIDDTTAIVTLGKNAPVTIQIPNTGSWSVFAPVSHEAQIKAGEQIIRIDVPNNAFDFDKFTISAPSMANSATGTPIFNATYMATTNRRFEVSWEPVEGATSYKVQLYYVEHDIMAIGPQRVAETKWEFQFPYGGHFIVLIQACNEDHCTKWSRSDNADVAVVNGKPHAWWLYGY